MSSEGRFFFFVDIQSSKKIPEGSRGRLQLGSIPSALIPTSFFIQNDQVILLSKC